MIQISNKNLEVHHQLHKEYLEKGTTFLSILTEGQQFINLLEFLILSVLLSRNISTVYPMFLVKA